MTTLPLVSVVIPTFNRKALVCEAIDSALGQHYENFEIIVVDDGSTDGTAEHLEARYGSKVSIVRNRSPTGCGPAKNLGAQQARGELLAFLDSDDIWLPNKLNNQVEVLQAGGPNVGLVGSACSYIDVAGADLGRATYPRKRTTYADFCVRVQLPGSGSNHLIRTEVFRGEGGFDEALTRAQDKDLWRRIRRSHDVAFSNEVTAKIRAHEGERVGVDIDVRIRSRLAGDQKIEERLLRRKARAWTYYSAFTFWWSTRPPRATWYLIKSFLTFPFPLTAADSRVKGAILTVYPQLS